MTRFILDIKLRSIQLNRIQTITKEYSNGPIMSYDISTTLYHLGKYLDSTSDIFLADVRIME